VRRRPIRLWVGVTPGGSTDTLAREIAPEMGRLLGRTVIVENRSRRRRQPGGRPRRQGAPDGSKPAGLFTSHTINASCTRSCPSTRWPTSRR
jgi:hypothetical protein